METVEEQLAKDAHINIYDDKELAYWSDAFDVCSDALLRAVERAGTLVKEVEEMLERNRKHNSHK